MPTHYSEAFADQIAAFRIRLSAGMPRVGWKVGLNVPEVQRKLGLAHSLVGFLDGERVFASGATIALSAGAKLHVEPELCIRVATQLDASCADPAVAFAAVGGIAPALELVDYAIPVSGLADVVRCSMFHHGTVIGAWQPPRRTINIAADVSLKVDELLGEPARSELVSADVGEVVLQIARLLAEVGEKLAPADLILSGSFLAKALPVHPGQTAHATLGDFGSVCCTLRAD